MASSQSPADIADTSVPTETSEDFTQTEWEDGRASLTESPNAVESSEVEGKDKGLEELKAKWSGWPGNSAFRLVVPVLKVGGIIGRKGDLVKKLVEETRARVRVLDGPQNSPDRTVVISGKEEPDSALPPAVDAIIRIFKRVSGLPDNDNDGDAETTGATFCVIRLLVPSVQATSLIGKQGCVIRSIQETSGASVRVLSNVSDEIPTYANSEERFVELQGEALKYNAQPTTQERQVDFLTSNTLLHATPRTSSAGDNYLISVKRDSLFLDHDNQMDTHMASSRHSLYEAEYGLGVRSSTFGRSGGPVVSVTQIVQTIQVPLAYAEDIIGVQGTNIDYIRHSSGATLTVQESSAPEEIIVEIKGISSQVQAAQQLIQQFVADHKESLPSSYGQPCSLFAHFCGGVSRKEFKCTRGIMATKAINLLRSFYEQGNRNAPKLHRTPATRA